MAYAVIIDNIDLTFWICFGLIILECIILVVFRQMCPVTLIARKYSDSTKDNFDIFLPNWLARYNKLIYGLILAVILIFLIYRLLT
jgi:hypothetical protein